MKPLHAIVVEDIENSRLDLMDMIREYCPEVSVEGWAETGSQALGLLKELSPDIAFLDLSLKGVNIMELLQYTDLSRTSVIIVTGSERVDKKVVRPETVAYLNKPVDPVELMAAVQRVQRKMALTPKPAEAGRLKISNKDGLYLVELTELVKLVADNNRTLIYTSKHPQPISTSRTLKKFDFLDDRDDFCRIHNSYLINLHCVKKYQVVDGGWVTLSDGSSLSISRNNLPKFLEKVERFVISDQGA